ncbi:MAG: hypothetical protein MHPSP_000673 [Paramarteilia canceri]
MNQIEYRNIKKIMSKNQQQSNELIWNNDLSCWEMKTRCAYLFITLMLTSLFFGYKIKTIFYGRESKREEANFMVRIFFFDEKKTSYTFCGGSIIDELHVLTAAHCLWNYKNISKDIYIEIVTGDLKVNEKEISEQIRIGEKIFIHDNYDDEKLLSDIAIIRLDEPLIFKPKISPIKFDDELHKTLNPGLKCKFFGWGLQENDEASEYLKVTELIIKDSECDGFGSECEVCTTPVNERVQVAEGDSGGPLVCSIDNQGYVQYGILSYKHIDDPKYAAFTNLACYNDWIKKTIKN